MKKRHLFNIALEILSAQEGQKQTATSFCREMGISTTFLYAVLDGDGTSARVEKAIDDLIERACADQRDVIEALAA